MDIPDIDNLLRKIGDHSSSDAAGVFRGYEVFASHIGSYKNISESFKEYVIATCHAIYDMSLPSDYITSFLLYFPLALDKISVDDIYEKFGSLIGKTCDSQLDILRSFESYFPWNNIVPVLPIRAGASKREGKLEQATRSHMPNAFIELAKTPEVVTLKLIDRLEILKHLESLKFTREQEKALAQNTLYLHAEVADMMGYWTIKSQIEDLAFKIDKPEAYAQIIDDLNENMVERSARLDRAIQELKESLAIAEIKADVTGRPKHIYSIYRKQLNTGMDVSQINDIQGLRIIVPDQEDSESTRNYCVKALEDVVFVIWEPVKSIYDEPEGYRDWIKSEKPNSYQSLHATVLFEERLLEVQVRSRTMHDVAENGLAAHWIYKRAGNSITLQKKYMRIIENINAFKDSIELRGASE